MELPVKKIKIRRTPPGVSCQVVRIAADGKESAVEECPEGLTTFGEEIVACTDAVELEIEVVAFKARRKDPGKLEEKA